MRPSVLLMPLLLCFAGALTASATDSPSPPTPEQAEFFEKKIRPLLIAACSKCHSDKSAKLKGGLRLDSRAGLLKGGDSGPALIPGQPEKSKLIEAIRYKNSDLQMPPRGKLADSAIIDLTAWVKMVLPGRALKLPRSPPGKPSIWRNADGSTGPGSRSVPLLRLLSRMRSGRGRPAIASCWLDWRRRDSTPSMRPINGPCCVASPST